MKKLIMKLLGLETMFACVELSLELLRRENEELTNKIKHLNDEVSALEERVQEKIDELETPDMDDYVLVSDLDDNIESYLNNNDYVTTSYVDDEVESKVSDAVESAIEDLDFEDKVKEVVKDMDKASFGDTEELKEIVRDLFNDASPAPMSENDIKNEVTEAVKVTLEKMVKVLADQQN